MGNRTEYVCTDFFFFSLFFENFIILYFGGKPTGNQSHQYNDHCRCHILRYGKIKVKKWKCESKIQFKNAENCSCHTIQIPRCDHRSQKDSKNRYCRDQRIFHSTVLYPQTDHKTHQLNPDGNGYISYDIQCFFHPNLLSPYLLHPYISL